MQRLIKVALVTFLVVGAVGLPAALAFIFLKESGRIASKNAVVRRHTVQRPAAPPVAAPEPAKPERRLYTWAEIEALLGKLRQERKERPQATAELEGWYDSLESPQFTDSRDFPEHCTRLAEWRSKFPDSPTPLIVLAKAHIRYAWEARGSGWAATVTNEGWEQFHTRIEEAHRLLERAVELGVNDGAAFSALIEVAKAKSLSHELTRAYLNAGMKLDPTYMDMYKQMAVYLLPRWLGEPGDIAQFAAEIVQKVPGDDGLEAYGEIAYQTHRYEGDYLFRGGLDRALLVKAAEVLAQRYPQSENMTCFAALCTVAAQDHAAARRIRPFVPQSDAPNVPLWRDLSREYFRWCDATVEPTNEANWVWGAHGSYGNLAFAKDSRYVWCGQGYDLQPIALLDLKDGGEQSFLVGPGGGINDFAFDPNKNWLAAIIVSTEFKGWVFWDVAAPEEPLPYPTPEIGSEIVINPGRKQIAWAVGKTVRTMDMETRMEGPRIDLAEHVHFLRFSADGKQLAVQSNGISVFDAEAGTLLYEFPRPSGKPAARPACDHVIDFDEEGRIWGTTMIFENGTTRYALLRFAADWATAETVIADLGERPQVASATLSPDRRVLAMVQPKAASGGAEKIGIWSLETGKVCQEFGGHWNHIGALTFSHDGKKLASIARMGGVIKIWDVGQTSLSAKE